MRPRTAFLLAPPLAPLGFWIGAAFLLSRLDGNSPGRIDWTGVLYGLQMVVLFGLPFAYVIALVAGVPAYLALRARGWLTWYAITAAGAVIGAGAAQLVPIAGSAASAAVLGAILGAIPAFVFWLLTRSRVAGAQAA